MFWLHRLWSEHYCTFGKKSEKPKARGGGVGGCLHRATHHNRGPAEISRITHLIYAKTGGGAGWVVVLKVDVLANCLLRSLLLKKVLTTAKTFLPTCVMTIQSYSSLSMNSDPTSGILKAKSTSFIYRDSVNQNTFITRKKGKKKK